MMTSPTAYDNAVYSGLDEVTVGQHSRLNTASNSAGTGSGKSESPAKKHPDSSCFKTVTFVLLALMLVLLLCVTAACIFFALEISKLKAVDSSQQLQQLQDSGEEFEIEINRILNASFEVQLEKIFLALQQQLQASEKIELLRKLNEMQHALNKTTQNLITSLSGLHKTLAAPSCTALPSSSPSGYYWVTASNGDPVYAYCNGTSTGGEWIRVAYLDMTNHSQQCPMGLRQRTDSGKRTCVIASNNNSVCSYVKYKTIGSYSKVSGKIRAFQYGSTDSFHSIGRSSNSDIDRNYVDGVSLTVGNPRRHVWTFAAALDEVGTHAQCNCPCINITQASQATPPPEFVGNDYFCDTGSERQFQFNALNSDDPLWDGAGCGPLNTCCSFNNPPWFYKQLSNSTTDDIEMRLCRDQSSSDEDIAIDTINIYVHA